MKGLLSADTLQSGLIASVFFVIYSMNTRNAPVILCNLTEALMIWDAFLIIRFDIQHRVSVLTLSKCTDLDYLIVEYLSIASTQRRSQIKEAEIIVAE